MVDNIFAWIVFAVVIVILLFIDLYLTDKRKERISVKSSLIWSGVWISTAFLFCLFIYFFIESGHTKAIEFLTGFLIEKSLSVDNLFIFLMIFKVMNVSNANQPHVLKWGILSAIIFRVLFILVGVGLIKLFQPVIYIFGIILLYAAYKMAFAPEYKIDLEKNPIIKFIKRYFNMNSEYHGRKFFLKEKKKVFVTSMFLTFILIESSDIIFAVDSIPAVIAITRDSFIIITSNIFAILGLRALYFAIAGIVDIFIYLKYGVALILFYVGVKMMISEFYKIPSEVSLFIILGLLGGSIIISLLHKRTISH
ncbi:MAG TPA: TerC/Alx family metal homeostasis membrane protein [Ignavibacteriaceae bacterium]|nr:TerC/Alx family metal homeostasis membrane protein [Ignavibacteriaceae bacterium]